MVEFRNMLYEFNDIDNRVVVTHNFEEKRGDIVFGISSFHPSFLPSSRSRYLVFATPPTVLC